MRGPPSCEGPLHESDDGVDGRPVHKAAQLEYTISEPCKGDLIIRHQALPHGASPNRCTRPRTVQYINMFAADFAEQQEWI
ncbi:MAG: hypothetical protein WC670_04760 [Pseudolabrys sp.]|jgi:ectoine hydroxylase-related dioxygenase (phytanoyl-CoA dioxygenase family)